MQYRLSQVIGSGEFGEVWKAIWMAPQGPMDVAIKVLKESHEMEDQRTLQLKLLTEAAVMGQFMHQNIVRLYGMVTVTQPVSYSSAVTKSIIFMSDLEGHAMIDRFLLFLLGLPVCNTLPIYIYIYI